MFNYTKITEFYKKIKKDLTDIIQKIDEGIFQILYF
jgi:hypothetical protein